MRLRWVAPYSIALLLASDTPYYIDKKNKHDVIHKNSPAIFVVQFSLHACALPLDGGVV